MLSYRLHIVFFILGFTLAFVVQPTAAQEQDSESKMRIGTFDSRAVGLAYGRSAEFKNEMTALHERHAEAKKSGDEDASKKMEEEAQATQELLHNQVFGSYSVAEILETVKDKLPAIAKDAGVIAIVSKWDLVYQAPGYEFVDVTMRLAMLFNPTEETLKYIDGLKDQEPVPLDELEHNHEH